MKTCTNRYYQAKMWKIVFMVDEKEQGDMMHHIIRHSHSLVWDAGWWRLVCQAIWQLFQKVQEFTLIQSISCIYLLSYINIVMAQNTVMNVCCYETTYSPTLLTLGKRNVKEFNRKQWVVYSCLQVYGPQLILVTRQSACIWRTGSHKLGGRLPLLSTRPTVSWNAEGLNLAGEKCSVLTLHLCQQYTNVQ